MYDTDGSIIGFYSDDIHKKEQIPKNVIPITDEEWIDCLNNQGCRKIDINTKRIIVVGKPVPTTDQLLTVIRANRDRLLAKCDWTQLPDVVTRGTLTPDQVKAWADYRKALCDFPANCDPYNPKWPAEPKV